MVRRRVLGTMAAGSAVVALLSGCVAEPPAGIGGSHYRSTTVDGDSTIQSAVKSAPVSIWFERNQGELDMIAAGPVNAYTVPVSFDGSTVVPDKANIRGTAVGCAGVSPSCTVDGWLSRFVSTRLSYRAEGTTLRLTGGAVTLALMRR